MRKCVVIAIGAVLVASFGLTAISGADSSREVAATTAVTKTFRGKFDGYPNTTLRIVARWRNGKARNIDELHYQNLPAICGQSGQNTFDTTGTGAPLPDRVPVDPVTRRFGVTYSYGPAAARGRLTFKGRFSSNWRRVSGTYQSRQHFLATGQFPEETCASKIVGYHAAR